MKPATEISEQRTCADIETEFDGHEAALAKTLEIHEQREHLKAMRKAFGEHSINNRDLIARVRRLESELHRGDRRAELARNEIVKAAGARAAIAAAAIRELAALLPAAKAQAQKGKPALLRMILRATK